MENNENNEKKNRMLQQLQYLMGDHILNALKDDSVVEVILNPDGALWLDKHGSGMIDTGVKFSQQQSESILNTIAGIKNIQCNRENPVLECELPLDNSRFEGLLPPVVAQASFTIRKKSKMVFTLDDYVAKGIMSVSQQHLINNAVVEHQNILVVGGTGSGKTTLLNAVLDDMSKKTPNDRIITIEDTLELQCNVPNKTELRTSESATMNKLLKATLRLRPDRIIVGEVRGPEALSLLKAWNTGHPGGLATIHANSARAGLTRLDQLIQEAGVPSQRELISEAVNLVIFIERANVPSGRIIKEIIQVVGYSSENKNFITIDQK